MRSQLLQEIEKALGFAIYLPDYNVLFAGWIMLGFVLSIILAVKRGISEVKFYRANLLILIFIYVGARLYHTILHHADKLLNPLAFFLHLITPGGTGSFGAYFGLFIGIVIVLPAMKINMRAAMDIYALIAALSLILGRLACFMRGCCYGSVTELTWSVSYPVNSPAFNEQLQAGLITTTHLRSLPVHPTQLYEVVFGIFMFILLMQLYRKYKLIGGLFFVYFSGYSIFRFIVEFFRGDKHDTLMLLSIPQCMAVFVFIISIGCLLLIFRNEIEVFTGQRV